MSSRASQVPLAMTAPPGLLWTKVPAPVANLGCGVNVPIPVISTVSPLSALAMAGHSLGKRTQRTSVAIRYVRAVVSGAALTWGTERTNHTKNALINNHRARFIITPPSLYAFLL